MTDAGTQRLLLDLPVRCDWQDQDAARRAYRRWCRGRARERRRLALATPHWVQCHLPWVDMPRTVGDCRGPGICPVLRCRHNLALWINGAGGIKVSLSHRRGLRTRSRCGLSADEMADLVVELADRLPSLCSLDYAELGAVSVPGLAAILGVSRQMARIVVRDAQRELRHALDIDEARTRRRAEEPLVQIRTRLVVVQGGRS